MISSIFGLRSGKCSNNDWNELSFLITGWIGWKFCEMDVLSDLSEIVCNLKKKTVLIFVVK